MPSEQSANQRTLSEHFDDIAIWNMDYHLAAYIARGIREFSEHEVGVPRGVTEDEWKAIRDEMATGFELYAKDPTRMDSRQSLDRSLELFAQWFTELWY